MRLSDSPLPTNRIWHLRAAALVATLFAAMSMAGGASPASAADNEVEDAAEAVYWAVYQLPNSTVRGRTIETQCVSRRSPYSCSWWVIKGRSERRATGASDDELPVMSRRGEGNAHTNSRRVLTSGRATATWGCTRTKVRGKWVTSCAFSVRLS